MDEAAGDLVAERRVLHRVEDEGVPADVHLLAGREAHVREVGAELDEAQCGVHDGLGFGDADGLVLSHPAAEPVEQRLIDEIAVEVGLWNF